MNIYTVSVLKHFLTIIFSLYDAIHVARFLGFRDSVLTLPTAQDRCLMGLALFLKKMCDISIVRVDVLIRHSDKD